MDLKTHLLRLHAKTLLCHNYGIFSFILVCHLPCSVILFVCFLWIDFHVHTSGREDRPLRVALLHFSIIFLLEKKLSFQGSFCLVSLSLFGNNSCCHFPIDISRMQIETSKSVTHTNKMKRKKSSAILLRGTIKQPALLSNLGS